MNNEEIKIVGIVVQLCAIMEGFSFEEAVKLRNSVEGELEEVFE